ncbi:dicarboxylic amino acid permease [Ascoidea rubescens DSM 1968]|uniref:Dicarboxylic amino acid permease n=1 Tax=Ascoidea rubescens DSM 1968 TaxID=1344418 RepID=A0A1D2V9X4_9ASCO|nr:dicarboxylic amino acid permease [Ascoidea rubescens DSM 1968]ODV58452.1 dicarboxylic amino acid permease [Ascoidea rubescens DSM 1968]
MSNPPIKKDDFTSSSQDLENEITFATDVEKNTKEINVESKHAENSLKRDLKARHLSMIAICGALGVGLLIGTGNVLKKAGPGSLFISYSLVGLIVTTVMTAIGEMATYLPMRQSYTGFSARYVDPCLGFAFGWIVACGSLLGPANEFVAGAMVMNYWIPTDKVNAGVWVAIMIVFATLINYFGVKWYGEIEFWLCAIKVVVILAVIFMMLVLMLGGGPDHDRKGFRYWKNPGAFAEYKNNNVFISGNTGRLVAFTSSIVNAVFAYVGIENVGTLVGESQNPRRNIPRAVKLAFYRIILFYVICTLLLGCNVPFNSPLLKNATSATTSAAASPFVVAIRLAKISGLDHVLNGALLIFCFSSGNTGFYNCSRTLYSLANRNQAPKLFLKTNKKGVPIYALATAVLFSMTGFMCVSEKADVVFEYFVSFISSLGVMKWISVLITHIAFMNALKAQGVSRATLVYKSPFQPYASYISLGVCIFVALIKNFTVFLKGNFDIKLFITGYINIPLFIGLNLGYKLIAKSKRLKSSEVDLVTGKDVIDKEEDEFLAEQAHKKELRGDKKDWKWIYEHSIGYLF